MYSLEPTKVIEKQFKKLEFTDGLSLEEFEEEICEMAHLSKEDSGLPYKVLLDYLGKERNRENNSPRIMIWLDEEDDHYETITPVSIDKEKPEILIDREIPDFKIIEEWIRMHYHILIMHWNQKISDFDVLRLLGRRFVYEISSSERSMS